MVIFHIIYLFVWEILVTFVTEFSNKVRLRVPKRGKVTDRQPYYIRQNIGCKGRYIYFTVVAIY